MEQIKALGLIQSINTDTHPEFVRPLDGPAPHVKNNGIERDGGVTNLYIGTESDSLYNETLYCKNGGRIRLKYDAVNNFYRAYSGNKEVGTVPPHGVKTRGLIDAQVDDAAFSLDGTILTTRMRGTVAVIEEFDPEGDFIPLRTKEIATEAGVLQCFIIRRIDLDYTTLDAVVGVYENAGKLYLKVFLAAGGSYTIANQGGFIDVSQVFAWYDNGYILGSQDPSDRRVFCLADDGTQQGTYTDAYGLTARVDWANSTVVFYAFRDGLQDATPADYGYSFTPPGASWTIAALTLAEIDSIAEVHVVPGGIVVAYSTAASAKKLLWSDGVLEETFEIGHETPPEFFGLIDSSSDLALKVHTILYEGAYLSASWNKLAIGEPVTEIGEISGRYAPHIVKIQTEYWIIYRRGDTQFAFVQISDDLDTRIQELAPGTGVVNTISALNVVDTNKNTIGFGGNAFNGFVVVGFTPDPGGADKAFTAKHQGNFGGSVDTGEKTAVDVAAVTIVEILEGLFFSPSTESIDVYVAGDYFVSIRGTMSRITKATLADTLYVEDNRIPPPVGAIYGDLTISLLTSTAIREKAYDAYQLANEAPGDYTAFSLFGNIYLFDGDAIYQARLAAGVIQALDEVAQARGLAFLAASPTLAYFLSAFDNSLFTFDGGRTVTKTARLSVKGAISEGAYNVRDNTLVLVTADSLIFLRDNITTENALPYPTFRIFSTETGLYFVSGSASTRYLYERVNVIGETINGGDTFAPIVFDDTYDGGAFSDVDFARVLDGGTFDQQGDLLTLDLQTGFYGSLENFRQVAKKIVFRVYMETPAEIDVTITFRAFDQEDAWTETSVFTLGDTANPFDSNGYAFIEFIPARQRCLAFSTEFSTASKVWLMNVHAYIETAERAVVKNKG